MNMIKKILKTFLKGKKLRKKKNRNTDTAFYDLYALYQDYSEKTGRNSKNGGYFKRYLR